MTTGKSPPSLTLHYWGKCHLHNVVGTRGTLPKVYYQSVSLSAPCFTVYFLPLVYSLAVLHSVLPFPGVFPSLAPQCTSYLWFIRVPSLVYKYILVPCPSCYLVCVSDSNASQMNPFHRFGMPKSRSDLANLGEELIFPLLRQLSGVVLRFFTWYSMTIFFDTSICSIQFILNYVNIRYVMLG